MNKRYIRYFTEDSFMKTNTSQEITQAIFKNIHFSMTMCLQAYSVYSRVCLILGSKPISASNFVSDLDTQTILKSEEWANLFINSMLYSLLNVPELESLVKKAIDNKQLALSIAYEISKKNPRNLNNLIKVLVNVH